MFSRHRNDSNKSSRRPRKHHPTNRHRTQNSRIPGGGDNAGMSRSFDELASEAAAAPVDGWDFSWLDGRATEERPSWGYQRLMSQRLATVSAALDIETGGGEVLSGAETFPPT